MGNINDIINNIMTKSVFLTTSITGAHRSRTALLEVKMYKPCVISYGVLHFVSEQIHGLIAQVLQLDQVCKKLESSGFVG